MNRLAIIVILLFSLQSQAQISSIGLTRDAILKKCKIKGASISEHRPSTKKELWKELDNGDSVLVSERDALPATINASFEGGPRYWYELNENDVCTTQTVFVPLADWPAWTVKFDKELEVIVPGKKWLNDKTNDYYLIDEDRQWMSGVEVILAIRRFKWGN